MHQMRHWIVALRLRTLPLALAGWMVSISIVAIQRSVNWTVAILTLVTAFLLQILSNLANDYGDAVSGVDSDHRQGPDRMVQAGHISKGAMGRAVVFLAFLSLLVGCRLLFLAFSSDFLLIFIFLIVGLASIVAAVKYTVGKNPYGYAGFGDLFVFVFFGIVLVFGTYYLQVQSLDWMVLLPASSIGLLSIAVLNVNNIRDIESDRLSGKNSIPVRIGRKNAVLYHAFLLFGALATAVIFSWYHYISWPQFLFVIISFFFIRNIKAVMKYPAAELDPFLKQMAISTLLFSILFAVGLSLSSIF